MNDVVSLIKPLIAHVWILSLTVVVLTLQSRFMPSLLPSGRA
jgi:hypothetical protein